MGPTPFEGRQTGRRLTPEGVERRTWMRAVRRWSPIVLLAVAGCAIRGVESQPVVRVALFNIRELRIAKLEAGDDPQALAAAEILRRVRPDVLVINEIDHDYRNGNVDLASTARLFADTYLADLAFPHAWAAPNNTGLLTGLDLDGDGHVATDDDRGDRRHGGDSFGWGTYPGEYSMAVLSRFSLAGERARTFQHFLWKDLPGHHMPEGFYDAEATRILRLSSKSHWDLPVEIRGRSLHLLLSHPTPPVFDGAEDRNGRRNFDELRLWALYLDDSSALVDDAGRRGGYGSRDPFVIAGDLNASPEETTSRYGGRAPIDQLLDHPRVQESGPWLTSSGAVAAAAAAPGRAPRLHPERSTAAFGGGMRIDYVLPSNDVEILDGGVFWPSQSEDAEGARLAADASDHRLLWLDLRLR